MVIDLNVGVPVRSFSELVCVTVGKARSSKALARPLGAPVVPQLAALLHRLSEPPPPDQMCVAGARRVSSCSKRRRCLRDVRIVRPVGCTKERSQRTQENGTMECSRGGN